MCINLRMLSSNVFRSYLASIPWECTQLDVDIEENWQKWKDIFNAAVDQGFPKVPWKFSRSKNWLTRETIKTIKKKRQLYRKAKKSGKEQYYVRYKTISNSVRQMRRQDYQLHVKEIASSLENSTNQRPLWSWLKKIRKNYDRIPQLYHENKVHTSNDEKVEALNEYFQSIFTKEAIGNLQLLKTMQAGFWVNDVHSHLTLSLSLKKRYIMNCARLMSKKQVDQTVCMVDC